jgi:hypothetical protein
MKLIHNPACKVCTEPSIAPAEPNITPAEPSVAPACTDMIPCDRDFYITGTGCGRDNDMLDCSIGHKWHGNMYRLLSTVRIFETIFDARFDDDFEYVIGGYNAQLKIAFTHSYDKIAASQHTHAASWAAGLGVHFYVIGADVSRSVDIIRKVLEYLMRDGLLPIRWGVTSDIAMSLLRTKLRKMMADRILFENRLTPLIV